MLEPIIIKKAIESAIKRIEDRFRADPNVFLTEDDLRCNLFLELLKEPILAKPSKTVDDGMSIPVHSEVRWYGSNNKLKTRSDLVIFDPSQLRTSNDGKTQLPSKGYGFWNPIAVIEIKLRRINNPSNKKWNERICKDISKIKELQLLVDRDALYYLLVFDKKKSIQKEIQHEASIEIHYTQMPNRTTR